MNPDSRTIICNKGSNQKSDYFYFDVPYRVLAWKILNMVIPLSWGLFRTGVNDSINITEQTNSRNIIAIIPSGNYSAPSLATAIQNALNSASASQGNSLTYTCTFNNAKQRLTISANGNFSIINNSSSAYELGIQNTSNFSNTWTADNPVDLSGTKCIFVSMHPLDTKCDLLGSQLNIAGCIPCNSPNGEVLNFDGSGHPFNDARGQTISSLNFTFFDDQLRPLDLGNKNYTIILSMDII